MSTYYNENNPHAARWLRRLIQEGRIPPGDVDDRSIVDVDPADVRAYKHAHFFAGIGGWAAAGRLAGWPDDIPLWTGSCPCQPWSQAGEGGGADDERHLWPEWFRLISAVRPPIVMGEQVTTAITRGWFDEVASNLEDEGYAWRAAIVPACAIGAPHRRDRLWFVAHARGERLSGAERLGGEKQDASTADLWKAATERDRGAPWRDHRLAVGSDGISRLVKPGVRLLAHGIPERVGVLSGFGNAIVPQVGAIMMETFLACVGDFNLRCVSE